MNILLLAVFFLPALISPEQLYAQGSLQRVSLTYSSRSIASIDLVIAQDRGFFRDEALDAQLIQVRATAAIAALVSGEVHALGSIGSAIRASPRRAYSRASGKPATAGILARQPTGAQEL
jgi:ABC-type nitrate/sulfonate/bicarbonate transport system substrate-binding protein